MQNLALTTLVHIVTMHTFSLIQLSMPVSFLTILLSYTTHMHTQTQNTCIICLCTMYTSMQIHAIFNI